MNATTEDIKNIFIPLQEEGYYTFGLDTSEIPDGISIDISENEISFPRIRPYLKSAVKKLKEFGFNTVLHFCVAKKGYTDGIDASTKRKMLREDVPDEINMDQFKSGSTYYWEKEKKYFIYEIIIYLDYPGKKPKQKVEEKPKPIIADTDKPVEGWGATKSKIGFKQQPKEYWPGTNFDRNDWNREVTHGVSRYFRKTDISTSKKTTTTTIDPWKPGTIWCPLQKKYVDRDKVVPSTWDPKQGKYVATSEFEKEKTSSKTLKPNKAPGQSYRLDKKTNTWVPVKPKKKKEEVKEVPKHKITESPLAKKARREEEEKKKKEEEENTILGKTKKFIEPFTDWLSGFE